MFRRYCVPHLIGVYKQHHIKILCLLAVIIGSQVGFFQLQVTQDADASSQQQAAVVQIPDPNLRALIAETLSKNPNAPITVEDMERLKEIDARKDRGIKDLTGLQYATNLVELYLGWYSGEGNQVSDLSPVADLTNLRVLFLHHNPISDLSPVRGLTNLTDLMLHDTLVSDISPVRGLTNLTILHFHGTEVTDLSPISGLINLRNLAFSDPDLSDISPVAGLINLETIFSWNHSISDLSALSGLTKLRTIDLCGGNISDLTPLRGLTGLKELYLVGNDILDISPLAELTGLTRLSLRVNSISNLSPLRGLTQLEWLELDENDISDILPLAGLTGLTHLDLQLNDISNLFSLAGLTNLTWLNLQNNNISDVVPLAGLTNLTWLNVAENEISDLSPLDGFRENLKLMYHGNPAFPKGGPQIEGPWLWTIVPTGGRSGSDAAASGIDFLAQASGGEVTELKVATVGANVGSPVGDSLWIAHIISTADNNINTMANATGLGAGNIDHHVAYGSVTLNTPREQDTMMFVGSNDAVKVWLNGQLVHNNPIDRKVSGYADIFPVTLKMGINILLVAVYEGGGTWSGFFGFEPGTEYTAANPGLSYTFSKMPIHAGDTFTLDIGASDFFDLAGWQFDITFDHPILEAISVTEGNFLKMGSTTFFESGAIDNVSGKITGLRAARLSPGGVSGTGPLLQVTFKAKAAGETALVLQDVEFGDPTGALIPAGPHEIRITVGGQLATGDVNRDGVVSILDLILVARQLGQRVPANSAADLNGDGTVSILDLILAARSLGSTTTPAAPSGGTDNVDTATIAAWVSQARLEDDGSIAFKEGLKVLENLLASLIPEETALLANYPNPFNPETWIPYQLTESAEVTLTIYDINGQSVRRLAVGHQAAGMYRNRARALYWDGRNQLGESVASGLYFYALTAGEFTATRRMLILK